MPIFRIARPDGQDLGEVSLATPTLRVGDTVFRGSGPSLRVVEVIDPQGEDGAPLLVVEDVEPSRRSS